MLNNGIDYCIINLWNSLYMWMAIYFITTVDHHSISNCGSMQHYRLDY